jgi:hypothetical protein
MQASLVPLPSPLFPSHQSGPEIDSDERDHEVEWKEGEWTVQERIKHTPST